MASSLELEMSSEKVQETKPTTRSSQDSDQKDSEIKMKKKRYVPRIGCFKLKDEYLADEMPGVDRSLERENSSTGKRRVPTHLVVMVNGLLGRAHDWRFAEKQFLKKYPQDVIVHRSKHNSLMLTFDGVDIMGERLAEEVVSVIRSVPEVQKISFVCHSLGGLIARYAIAKLYGQTLAREPCEDSGDLRSDGSGNPSLEEKKEKIAGLEPMNFITLATPHLGSRGHKQVPIFCGINSLEKVASHASWMMGRTGKHLFLLDSDNKKPPLLVQMVNDSGDLKFLSALQSFKRHVAYANARFDQIVGWSTSSIRRRTELPKRQHLSQNDKYPHIVNVEAPKTSIPLQEVLVDAKVKGHKILDMEETMIRGLSKVSWERVDVCFKGSKQRILGHITIQVKSYCINSEGADVILHMIDNFLL